MFCENCGKQIPDTATFCTKCGGKVVRAQTGAPSTQPTPSVQSNSSYQASPAQAGSVRVGPVPPVTRPAPVVPPAVKKSGSEVSATLNRPVQPHGAVPGRPSQPYGAAPGGSPQSYGKTPDQSPQSHGSAPGQTKPDFAGSDVISYGQYMLMFILTSIPIVNIVLLIKWGFSGEVNPNKRNFSKAMLTFVLISFVLGIILWSSIAKSARMYY